YLKTKEVLKVVAEKLQVGSLILVSIKNELGGSDVELTVYGNNGEDILFSEHKLVKNNDIEEISDLILVWLELYSKSIPYDAEVSGVLGDQVTLDVDKSFPVK